MKRLGFHLLNTTITVRWLILPGHWWFINITNTIPKFSPRRIIMHCIGWVKVHLVGYPTKTTLGGLFGDYSIPTWSPTLTSCTGSMVSTITGGPMWISV